MHQVVQFLALYHLLAIPIDKRESEGEVDREKQRERERERERERKRERKREEENRFIVNNAYRVSLTTSSLFKAFSLSKSPELKEAWRDFLMSFRSLMVFSFISL